MTKSAKWKNIGSSVSPQLNYQKEPLMMKINQKEQDVSKYHGFATLSYYPHLVLCNIKIEV